MDVGNPSNFPRILELYSQDIVSHSFSDKQTLKGVYEVYKKYNHIIDPHSSIAYLGLKKILKNENGIFLETAHPAKFKSIVEKVIDKKINIPKSLQNSLNKNKQSLILSNKFHDLKQFLLSH